MIRITLCCLALLGFGAAARAGELDRETAPKATPASVAVPASSGSELDRETPTAAFRGHGGWGYGYRLGYGYGYGYGGFYSAGYAGFYRPYFGGFYAPYYNPYLPVFAPSPFFYGTSFYAGFGTRFFWYW